MGTRYTLHAVQLTGGANPVIGQISEWAAPANIEEMIESSSGIGYPVYVAIAGHKPEITFSSFAVASVLALLGQLGVPIKDDGTYTAFSAWLKKITPRGGGLRDATATATKLSMTQGLVVPVNITASLTEAKIACRAVAEYDGTNEPVVVTAAQTAVALVYGSEERFVCGPVKINGTTYGDVVNIEIDLGLEVVVEDADGQGRPMTVYVQHQQPKITVTLKDMSVLTGVGYSGLAQTATDSLIYLRKVKKGGGGLRVPDATAEHVKISIDDGMARIEGPSVGNSNESAQDKLVITPTFDGTNTPLVISTASAIT